jgi:hypothetical protein
MIYYYFQKQVYWKFWIRKYFYAIKNPLAENKSFEKDGDKNGL